MSVIKKIVTVIQAMENGVQTYLHPKCTPEVHKVDLADGPFVVTNIVDSSRYPNIAKSIGPVFEKLKGLHSKCGESATIIAHWPIFPKHA